MSSMYPRPKGPPKMHRVTLTFADEELERDYWAHHAEAMRGHYQIGAVAVGLLLLSFAPVDAWVFPELARKVWVVRYGLALPPLVLFLVMVFDKRRTAQLHRWVQELLLFAAAGQMAGVVGSGYYFSTQTGTTELFVSTMGLLVAVECLYGFTRLRFIYVAPLGAVAVAVAFAVATLRGQGPKDVMGTLAIFGVLMIGMGSFVAYALEYFGRRDFTRDAQLTRERARSEELLDNLLPHDVAVRMKRGLMSRADSFDDVAVLLVDIAGFTPLSEKIEPDMLVALLDRIFTRFDAIAERHGVEKIKTLGDAYLAATGVPKPVSDGPERLARVALEMRDAVSEIAGEHALDVRIGLDCGPAVAGVIGRDKFCYDVWGAPVAGAIRMESGGRPGKIQVTPAMYKRLAEAFELEPRGEDEPRSSGTGPSWWLLGPKEAS